MKKLILVGITVFLFHLCNAQQWMDKKYSYDSTMNVVYGSAVNFNGSVDTLRINIYSPLCNDPQQISRRPLMLVIHGGAFIEGSKDDASVIYICREFAKRGYVTTSVQYRLGFVADDTLRTCNFPNYSCTFATDTAEWYRAYYRAIQDSKGALRYMINRNQFYRIDTANVFVVGESAGAFTALGVALLDTASEKFSQAGLLPDATNPHSSNFTCSYNVGEQFLLSGVPRPDLGSVDGAIEPTTVHYTVKGVGNMFGAMLTDLLQQSKVGSVKSAIYSYHQPCDMIVPIDRAPVFTGLNWCFTNGYNCFAIGNTPYVYGSRAFSNLNTANAYGYTIQNDFTSTNFPYSYLIGTGSCLDQVNNPCHAYDNALLRENNLAAFFAPLVSTFPVCDTGSFTVGLPVSELRPQVSVYPNPFTDVLYVEYAGAAPAVFVLTDACGRTVQSGTLMPGRSGLGVGEALPAGIYLLSVTSEAGGQVVKRIVH
jgi:Carboxylesterase family